MKKLYATILYLGIFIGILFPFNFVAAYEVGTHAFLTGEIIKFYNQNFENKIPEEFNSQFIRGSIDEDDAPRWMNHFYDPVYHRGLTMDSGTFSPEDMAAVSLVNAATLHSRWISSQNWSQNPSEQMSATYNPLLKTTFAGLLAMSDPAALETTDYTWERAIKDYVRGDKERAFRGLGHILHLMEDASVPDHTRNDPHPAFNSEDAFETGSPYELWTGNFNLENPDKNLPYRLSNKKPIILSDLNSYFDGMATYSNNNFYSRDTIGIGKYNSPELDYIWQDGKIFYGFRKDADGSYYHLLSYKNNPVDVVWATKNNLDLRDKQGDKVLTDYWSRLSVKAVQNGAGVIDLFLKEVEKAKNDPNFVKEEPKSFVAQVVDLLSGFFSTNSNQGLKLSETVNLEKNNLDAGAGITKNSSVALGNSNVSLENSELINVQNFNSDTQNEDTLQVVKFEDSETIKSEIEDVPVVSRSVPAVEKNPVKACSFATDKIASHRNLIINEVAWMGTQNSANDEWIELKNISGKQLDVSGWQLLDKEEQIKIAFGNLKIENNGYLLLERTDDDSVPGIKADAIYAGALSNTDEGLRLFDNECDLIDEVRAGSVWLAGDSGSKKTMERSDDLSWHTYSGDGANFGGATIYGTPKQNNSQPAITSAGSVSTPVSNAVTASTTETQLKNILISEVQITGGTGQSDNEFIELYNPNDSAVDLSALPLKLHIRNSSGTDSHKTLTFINNTIPAKGYFLIGPASGYTGAVALDATYSASSGNKLVNNGGVYISKSATADTEVLDKTGWGDQPAGGYETEKILENPVANQSISRKSETDADNNANDFIKSKPTPKNSNTGGGFLSPDTWAVLDQSVDHLVISEIYPDRTGANKDFVELYNPNATTTGDLDISTWSLQVLSASATTTDKISKKNFAAGNKISGRGFFLIGVDSYPSAGSAGLPQADMNWASGSLNSTDGATIFLVNGTTTISSITDSRIIDRVAYGAGSAADFAESVPTEMPLAGQSLERKAFQNDFCVSAVGAGEYVGNGCDNDDNFVDFEVRIVLNPQTTKNLPEPRTAPSLPQNFSATYATSSAKMFLSWDASQDYKGATSTLSYSISQATSTSALKSLTTVSATTTYLFKVNDVGTDYSFSISAKDSEGLSSDAADVSLSVASPLANFYFYKDSRATTSKKYLFDFYYSSYPFIPNSYNNKTGGIMVFYLNKEAPNEVSLNSANHFYPQNPNGTAKDGVIGIVYTKCSGDSPSSNGSPAFSLILPGPCGTAGGAENATLTSGSLEDTHLLFALVKTTDEIIFTDQDFITIGMYSYYDYNNGWETYNLAALDRTKYFFQNSAPDHSSPEIGGSLAINFNKSISKLETEWQKATDSDTLDIFLTYEISYDGGDSWQSTGGQNKTSKVVVPGDSFSILVRAKDDFGNYSDPSLSADWSYPATVFSVSQTESNDWGASFGSKNQNCPDCAGSASLQSIQPAEDFQFNVLALRLWQEIASDTADLKLAVYPDLNNSPDFNSLIASSSLKSMYRPDKNSDIAFSFDSSITLSAGNKYWLVLGAEYANGYTGFTRNQWHNAINVGSDLYNGGQAGRGSSGICSNSTYCPFTVPYPNATADWHMKIGLAE